MTYIEPIFALLCILGLVGLVRLRRHCKAATPVLLVSICLFLWSWPPVDWLLSRPFEMWYPVQPFHTASPQAIVVLSESIEPAVYERPYPVSGQETYQRCELAAWLHSHWNPLPVLACGGRGKGGDQPFAATMRQLLRRLGVPDDRLWTEEQSRSTHENAAFGARILRQHGVKTIALIADATSMPRAAACFRREGINVVPAPSTFREFGPLREELLPSWKAIRHNEVILHEAVGLVWYSLHGWV